MIADLEAGTGTLTRLEAERVDAVLLVVEPTPKSLEVARRALALVRDKGLGRIILVANRLRDADDLRTIHDSFPDLEIVAVPDDQAIVEAERYGRAPLDSAPDAPAVLALAGLAERLIA